MPQTLLALFAIVLASVLTLHQARMGISTHSQTQAAEVQSLAAEVAIERMATLETLPFDEAVKDAYASSVADLTPVVGGAFVRVGPDPAGDDLDDAHGEAAETAFQVRQTAGGAALGGVPLRTTVSVAYVSEADGVTPSAVPTRFKRATVTVTPVDAALAQPVQLTQLFSCGSYCTW